MKLYEINQEIDEILSSIDEETGEITEEQFEQLTNLQFAREEKIENTALYIKNLKAEKEIIKKEKDRLADKERATENKIKSVTNYLKDMLRGEKYKSPLNSIYYGRSASVNITDFESIPGDYLIEQEPKVDKTAIRKAIQAGENISGAELKENQYIVIRWAYENTTKINRNSKRIKST